MTQKIRGFELVKGETNLDLLPKRSTQHSAGYDFVAAETITIDPGAIKLVPTNVKAYCTFMTVLLTLANVVLFYLTLLVLLTKITMVTLTMMETFMLNLPTSPMML